MFVPLWLLGLVALAFVVLARLAFARRGGEMLDSQRRGMPTLLPVRDEAALLARPEIAAHLAAGRKIEAIKAVRQASGLG
jgi:hypothetical protein